MQMNKNVIQVWKNGFRIFRNLILELCYPTSCILCGKLDPYGLCETCRSKMPLISEPRCMCCGKQLEEIEMEFCSDCCNQKHAFFQGRSIWLHTGAVKNSIYKFKYNNHRAYSEIYAKLWMEYFADYIERWEVDCIIPIPLHKHRERKRGYNQAEILAKALHKELDEGVLYEKELLYRKEETSFQKHLDNKGRKKNLKGVFGIHKKDKYPQTVLLIDDIYTTGATLHEVSKILRQAGVKKVVFLTISIGQGF